MSRYPVAYRKGADQHQAIQRPAPAGSGSGFQEPRPRLPLPANDNLPFPANDNELLDLLPDRQRKAFEKRAAVAASLIERALTPRNLIRSVLGPVGRIMDAYDIGMAVADVVYDVFDKKTVVTVPSATPVLHPADWVVSAGWGEYIRNVSDPSKSYPTLHGYRVRPDSNPIGVWNGAHDPIPGGGNFAPAGEPFEIGVGAGLQQIWRGDFVGHANEGVIPHYASGASAWRVDSQTDPWVSSSIVSTRIRLPRVGETVEISPAELLHKEWSSANVEPATLTSGSPRGTVNSVSASSIGRAPKLHVRRKRQSREKEMKIKTTSGVWKVVNMAVGAATETADFLEAIWKALPDHPAGTAAYYNNMTHFRTGKPLPANAGYYKSGHYLIHTKNKKTGKIEQIWVHRETPPPQVMAREIYDNLHLIDPKKALTNLALNGFEDYVFGKSGQALGEAAKQTRPHGDLPFGFGLGPAM